MVFGNDCAEDARIDNNEKTETQRRIRERINAGLKAEAKKLVIQSAECKNRILAASRLDPLTRFNGFSFDRCYRNAHATPQNRIISSL